LALTLSLAPSSPNFSGPLNFIDKDSGDRSERTVIIAKGLLEWYIAKNYND